VSRSSNPLLCIIGVLIAMVVIVFPLAMVFFGSIDQSSTTTVLGVSRNGIILQTLGWSLFVGLISTAIGWTVGVRIATLQRSIRLGIVATLLMSLAVPAYAVFYAWWQAWPSGTWLHGYLVEHSMLGAATKICLACALVGWSWPVPALIAMMTTKSGEALGVLHRLDGVPLLSRMRQRFLIDFGVILSSVVLVSALTAANTTCFDLAQIPTIGNELRAIVATGMSISGVPSLGFAGLAIATIASIIVIRVAPKSTHNTHGRSRSSIPIIVVWVLLSGGPLVVSAISSIRVGGLQLWKYYTGDMVLSGSIGIAVALLCILLLVTSTAMHLGTSRRVRTMAGVLDFGWIFVAFLPAGLLSSMLTNAWHHVGFDWVYRSPAILILAHLAHVGFVGSLAGRWVASCKNVRTLCSIDGVKTPSVLFAAVKPRILSAAIVVVGVTIAMSMGEVALTSQLSPPSRFQPIAVSLLNAMHYQRPEIVTSALCVIIGIAAIGGFLVFYTHRKYLSCLMLFVVLIGCDTQSQQPLAARVVGGPGLIDGRFFTPRAIDANEQVIVVIDKSGRLQVLDSRGEHIGTWNLPLSGTGYPTGVSLDQDGLVWVAETHGHRVLVYDLSGNEILRFGSYGTQDGEFLYPTDIAFSKNGEVYVSEYGGNDRISVFDREGNFLRTFGHHGDDPEGFRRPQSIAIEPETGNLVITDSGNHRIVVRDPDGEVLRIISTAGRGHGQMLYPYGITFVSSDSFLVCEYGNNRLQQFSIHGDHMGIFGGAGDLAGLFKTPWGIAKTPSGVIVADTGNNRLQLLPDMMMTQ